MIAALFRALLQLPDPPVRRVIWTSVTATIAAFLVLAAALSGLLAILHVTGIGWLDPVVDVFGAVAVLALAFLLFPAVVPGLSSLFLDDVAAAVEKRHFAHLAPPHPQAIGEQIKAALSFLVVSLGLNLLVLPLYLIPGMNLVIFLGLNGYLLGRMYFEQVAARRLDLATMAILRRRHRLRLWLAGVVISGLIAVPVLNLLAPIIATAFMVHIFHRLTGEVRSPGLG
jgi:uncharacterized protein involved in cysteine biosynthesis